MFLIEDLIPMDFITSYKPATNIISAIPDAGIKHHGRKLYPNGSVDWNHTRISSGKSPVGNVLGFEWTYPRAREIFVEPWMVDPAYSRVMRFRGLPAGITFEMVQAEYSKHIDKRYDWLQLFGILLGQQWLQLGDEYEVCSTGAVEIFQDLTGLNLFKHIADWEVPPCSFVNHPELFECMNVAPGNEEFFRLLPPKAEPLYKASGTLRQRME